MWTFLFIIIFVSLQHHHFICEDRIKSGEKAKANDSISQNGQFQFNDVLRLVVFLISHSYGGGFPDGGSEYDGIGPRSYAGSGRFL